MSIFFLSQLGFRFRFDFRKGAMITGGFTGGYCVFFQVKPDLVINTSLYYYKDHHNNSITTANRKVVDVLAQSCVPLLLGELIVDELINELIVDELIVGELVVVLLLVDVVLLVVVLLLVVSLIVVAVEWQKWE